jgi:hypothetical protein
VVVGDVAAGGRLRDGGPLTFADVRPRLSDADLAVWEERRQEELRHARELIAAAARPGQ